MVIRCGHCNMCFFTGDIKLRQREIVVKQKREFVTYYVCPHCNTEYEAIVDSEKTIEIRRQIQHIVDKIASYRKRGVNPREELIVKLQKKKQRLRIELDKLNTKTCDLLSVAVDKEQ